jgi:hypothetical protein
MAPKGLVGDKLTEIEEKYDLTKGTEGFGSAGSGRIGRRRPKPKKAKSAEEGEEEAKAKRPAPQNS